MNTIPTYALYGEAERPLMPESLHCESIADRSQLYDWEIRSHRHELFAQVLHIRDGSVVASFDGASHEMTGPCLVVVPPLSPHGFRFSSDVEGNVVTVVAQQVKARLAATPALAALFETSRKRAMEAGSSEAAQVDTALGALVREFAGNAPWRSPALDAALTLSLLLVGRALAQPEAEGNETGVGAAASSSSRSASRSLRHVKRFLAAVDQGYREQRSVESYAEPLGITPTQLNRVCRQVLGRTALQAVHARLLLEAERDLAYTSLSVKEIGLTLGFADAAYFTRFFARLRGMSPSDYRRASRAHLARS